MHKLIKLTIYRRAISVTGEQIDQVNEHKIYAANVATWIADLHTQPAVICVKVESLDTGKALAIFERRIKSHLVFHGGKINAVKHEDSDELVSTLGRACPFATAYLTEYEFNCGYIEACAVNEDNRIELIKEAGRRYWHVKGWIGNKRIWECYEDLTVKAARKKYFAACAQMFDVADQPAVA